MGVSNGGGGVSLPIHVPSGGSAFDAAADSTNVVIGGNSPNRIQNLVLKLLNILDLSGGAATTWLAVGSGNGLLTSRQISQAAEEAATVGAAGGAAALPAQPLGYWIRLNSAGNPVKIPYYNP